jgi:hypothetical protein
LAGLRSAAVDEHLLVLGELGRDELVDEGHVVVDAPDVEDALPSFNDLPSVASP